MQQDREKNFIKIDEVIKKAQDRGVDFGSANPRSRLRYYAKLDLLPPAERKVFEGNQPTGAYPEEVVDLLVEIDQEINQGKSIKEVAEEKKEQEKNQESGIKNQEEKSQEVQQENSSSTLSKEKVLDKQAEEQAREDFEKDRKEESPQKAEVSYQAPPFTLIPTYQKNEDEKSSQEQKQGARGSDFDKFKSRTISVLTSTLKFASLALLVAAFGYTLGTGILKEKMPSGLTAFLLAQPLSEPLVQAPSGNAPGPNLPAGGNKIFTPTLDPYLTINVETDINAPLNLKSTTTPTLSFHQDDSEGVLTTADLTADRNYTLPNQSGIVCLSTGNCLEQNRVTSPGGATGRLPVFTGSDTLGNSSIRDLYRQGELLTITEKGSLRINSAEGEDAAILESGDSPFQVEAGGNLGLSINQDGEVGVGKDNPEYQLDVEGGIQASGDICTDESGGKCLSDISGGKSALLTSGGGVDGSGDSGYLARWTDSFEIDNSAIYQSGSDIGIGNNSPGSALDVSGTITMNGFKMPTNATSNYVLTATSSGVGSWKPLPVTRPKGDPGQTLRHDGSTWVTSSFFTNLGDAIGIGTTSPDSALTVVGDTQMEGTLTLATSSLPQLMLQNGTSSNLKFSVSTTSTEIITSKDMTLTSLSGSIKTGSAVNLIDASNATVSAATFLSGSADATVRSSDEYVLRASVPVYPYSMPAQTATTSYVKISKHFSVSSSLASSTPEPISGTTRKYAFLINYADNIDTGSSSNWRVRRPDAATTSVSFALSGQSLASLDEGYPHLTNFYDLPDNDWQLEVNPQGKKVRVFNVLILVYDEVE